MGYRLEGPSITHRAGPDIISDGMPAGGIQVPGRQPMILLVDRQSTGGYAKIVKVISTDIGLVAQAEPGRRIHFRAITLAEAHLSSDRPKLGLRKSSRANRTDGNKFRNRNANHIRLCADVRCFAPFLPSLLRCSTNL